MGEGELEIYRGEGGREGGRESDGSGKAKHTQRVRDV